MDDQDMMTSIAGNLDMDYFDEEGEDNDNDFSGMNDIKERFYGDEED